MESEMQPYAGFQPTGFDSRGLRATTMGLGDDDDADRSTWLVVPVGQTRDSGCLDRSNFASATAALEQADEDEKDWECHRFGHWGPGWFEILIVRPDTAAHQAALEMETALVDYPILDDGYYSDLQAEQMDEDWENWAATDFRAELERKYCGALEVDLWDVSSDDLWELARDWDVMSPGEDGIEFYWHCATGRWAYPRSAILLLPQALIEDRPISIRTDKDGNRSPILSRRQVREWEA